jgi:hypothetical protein
MIVRFWELEVSLAEEINKLFDECPRCVSDEIVQVSRTLISFAHG